MTTPQGPMSERVASLLSLGGNPYSPSNTEDISQLGLRPLPSSRDQSSSLHRRYPSTEFPPSSSTQHSRSASRDQSPGAQARYPGQAIYPSASSPSLRPQQNVRSHSGPIPVNPHAGLSASFPGEGALSPPPRIGELIPHHSHSPRHSRAGSTTGSFSDSRPNSPVPTLDLVRPPTPTEGKLTRRKSWILGKSHGRSASGSNVAPGPLAWIISAKAKTVYDISYLANSRVSHLSS